MTTLLTLLAQLLHAALMLAAAPLVAGLLGWVEARLQGRSGPPVLQPWRDLVRLARKQAVFAENVSSLYRLAPALVFAAVAVAALLVPSFTLGMTTAPAADLLVIAGLLLLARCVLALAAMDTGTAFGGIGAGRGMFLAVFAEPALLLVIFVFSLIAGGTNVDAVAATLRDGARLPVVLAAPALLAVVLADLGRLAAGGVLELGMADAAGMLDYSGRPLALLQAAAALRLVVGLSLISIVFVPFGVAPAGGFPGLWVVGLVAWALKVCVLVVAMAAFGTVVARMRLFRVPEFLGVALLLALVAAVLLMVEQGAV